MWFIAIFISAVGIHLTFSLGHTAQKHLMDFADLCRVIAYIVDCYVSKIYVLQ